MAALVTLPSIPVQDNVPLPAGHVATQADMNALSYACTFAMNKPLTRVHQASPQTFPSLGNVNWDTVDYDSEGMYSGASPGRLTIMTPGVYKVRYMVNCGAFGCTAYAQTTTGPNNPAGSGITEKQWAAYTLGGAPSNGALGASGVLKTYCYIGDYVQIVFSRPAGSVTTITTDVDSWMSLEWISI